MPPHGGGGFGGFGGGHFGGGHHHVSISHHHHAAGGHHGGGRAPRHNNPPPARHHHHHHNNNLNNNTAVIVPVPIVLPLGGGGGGGGGGGSSDGESDVELTNNTECVEHTETSLLNVQTPHLRPHAHAAGFSARHRWLFFFLFVFFILGLAVNIISFVELDTSNFAIFPDRGATGFIALSAILGMLITALIVQHSALHLRLYWTISLFLLLLSFVFFILQVHTYLGFGIRFIFSCILTATNAGGVVSSLTLLVWATRVDRCAFWLALAAAWTTEWISGTALVNLYYWLIWAFAPLFWTIMVCLFVSTLILLRRVYTSDLHTHLDQLHAIQHHAPKISILTGGPLALYLASLFYFFGSFEYVAYPPQASSYLAYYYSFIFALLLGAAVIPRMVQTRGWRTVAVWGLSMNLIAFIFILPISIIDGYALGYSAFLALESLNIIFWTVGTTFFCTSLFAMARNLVPGRSLVWVYALIFSIAYLSGFLGHLIPVPSTLGLGFGLPFGLCILSLISIFFLPPAAQGPQLA